MCGRYSLTTPEEAMRRVFGYDGPLLNLPPRYNIAPTQILPVIRAESDGSGRLLERMRWGLVPSWAKDLSIGARLINARAETVADKPSFRSAFRKRRCLVPADGYFEWQKTGTDKQPWFIRMRSDDVFAFAGLWETWTDESNGETVVTYAIVTTEANDLTASIHHRMPVIVAPADYDAWLNAEPEAANGLLRAFPSTEMVAHPVGKLVNNVGNDVAACLEPAEPAEPVQRTLL